MTTRAFRSLFDWWWRLWLCRPRIEIDLSLWREMVQELGRRSLGGTREAGVFLLVPAEEEAHRVVRVAYFDDLDPECLAARPRNTVGGWSGV